MNTTKKPLFRFEYITDNHFTQKNPEHRLDDMFFAGLKKLDEVFERTQIDDVETYLLDGGDIFNSPNISDRTANIVGNSLKKWKGKILAIAGNHDTEGNNLNTLYQTKLGVLDNFGILRVIKPYEKIVLEKEGVSVQITGSSSNYGINNEEDMFIIKEKTVDIAIHMVHAMLVAEDRKFGSYVPLRNIQDKTKADITLSGDWHLGFETVIYEGKYFANPGAIVRKYALMEEINRMPKFIEITVYDDKSFDLVTMPIKCAKPGNEVLDRSKILATAEYNEKLLEFSNTFSFEEQKTYDINIENVISQIASNKSIDNEICQNAIDTVRKFDNLLSGDSENGTNYIADKNLKISKIIGHNFQSHKHTEVEIDEHLNVFVGKTDSGKTSFVSRLLKWVLCNDLDGNFFVRDNEEGLTDKKGKIKKEDECYGTVIFNDGSELTRKRVKNKNYYELIDENGEVFPYENFGDTIPLKIKEKIGCLRKVIDKDLTFNYNLPLKKEFNLIYQNNGIKAKVIGSFAGANVIDASVRDLQARNTKSSSKISTYEEELEETNVKISVFGDMEQREKLINKGSALIEKITKDKDTFNKLSESLSLISEKEKQLKDYEDIIQSEKSIIDAEKKVSNLDTAFNILKDKTKSIDKIIESFEKLNALNNSLSDYTKIISSEKEILNLELLLKEKDDRISLINKNTNIKMNNYNALYQSHEKIKELNSQIDKQDNLLKTEKDLINKENSLSKYNEKISLFLNKKLNETYDVLNNSNKIIQEKEIIVKKLDTIIDSGSSLEQKEKLLAEYNERIESIMLDGNTLTSNWRNLYAINTKINEYRTILFKYNDKLIYDNSIVDKYISEYIQEVKNIGKCPLCFSDLTPEHIANIEKELR